MTEKRDRKETHKSNQRVKGTTYKVPAGRTNARQFVFGHNGKYSIRGGIVVGESELERERIAGVVTEVVHVLPRELERKLEGIVARTQCKDGVQTAKRASASAEGKHIRVAIFGEPTVERPRELRLVQRLVGIQPVSPSGNTSRGIEV